MLRRREALLRFFGAFGPVVVLVQVAVSGGALHREENRGAADGAASMVGKAGNVYQVSSFADTLFVAEDEVELALKYKKE